MMKIWLLLLFTLLIPFAFAKVECSSVFIVNFNYKNGFITYKDKIIKCGYCPDYKLQPEEGYIAELVSIDNKVLYKFRFEIPLKIQFDEVSQDQLSGGLFIFNETDFALIFPYYDNAKSIVIYNSRRYKVLEVPLIEERFIQKKTSWLWLFMVLLLILISTSLIYKHFKKPPQQPYSQKQLKKQMEERELSIL